MSQITYPSIVSRTLDPTGKGFLHITGLHDRRLSDADLNILQDLAENKRKSLLADQVSSGCLTWKPFLFDPTQSLSFTIPAFDALVNGDLIRVGGNHSADGTLNLVTVPGPSFWTPGSSSPAAQIQVIFLEAWYQRLDTVSGTGYSLDPITGARNIYPSGCVNAVPTSLIPNDTVDPFSGQVTTERVQLQWALRVQPVALSYDFTRYDFGLDAGAIAAETVYGQANQGTPSTSAIYSFSKMGPINGDTGLWRAGDGNALNELGSMDGYSYALPVAVVFQRNTGAFSPDRNPFGCASITSPQSGLLGSGITGRYDEHYADAVYPEDVVDTRSTVSLTGWQGSTLVERGFADLISGHTQSKIARGETPGSQTGALGSQLAYTIAVNATALANTDTVGAFDGYRNGFSSMAETSYVTKAVTVNSKAVGALGSRWSKGDAFTISLPASSQATISSISVQGLVSDAVNSTKTPVLLLSGQITITGLGTRTVTVAFARELNGTTYDPGLNSIYCTIGVAYPASGGMDLRKIPSLVFGGSLQDGASGKTLPVFGVSEYAVSRMAALESGAYARVVNPEYSNIVFGSRLTVPVDGSSGTATTSPSGTVMTTFNIPRTALNGSLNGLYVVSASDATTGQGYSISSRSISGGVFTLGITGKVPTSTTLACEFLLADTVQLAYNAPSKGVAAIEETVLVGNLSGTGFHMDTRVQVVSTKNYAVAGYNTVVLATTEATMTGLAGDDSAKLIWVLDTTGNLNAVQVSSAIFANGFVTLTVPASVNLEVQRFFLVAALRPAFSATSQLVLTQYYIPYQGEGKTARDYEMLYTEGTALVTTNGTGASPVPGLADVYPYNRELPIVAALPSQIAWLDSGLTNSPVSGLVDSNYDAKRFNNVEHTFEVPVHTNDFIEPIHDGKRKSLRLTAAGGGRGFSKAIPHMGFAIRPIASKRVLGSAVTMTSAPVTLYVDGVSGLDANDGLTVTSAKQSLASAVNALPALLCHPCSIQIITSGGRYSLSNLSGALEVVALGDGASRPFKQYCLASLAFGVQDQGRLVISALAGSPTPAILDATGFTGFGDGPTSGFFVNATRVLFNNVQFVGFRDPAVKALDANVAFYNCSFVDNLTAGSFEQGSSVVLDGCSLRLGDAGTGMILSQSDLADTGSSYAVDAGATPGAFFVAERGSSLSLAAHTPGDESNLGSSTVVAEVQLNSSVICARDYSSLGQAVLSSNSVLNRTVAVAPFAGGVTADSSSAQTTSL